MGATTTACGKCRRKLKNPVSIERGYGPQCWETVKDENDIVQETNAKYLAAQIAISEQADQDKAVATA